MLDKQEKLLEKKMDEARRTAVQKSRKGNKKAAIFQLKKRKMCEKRLNQLYGQRENVERLINAMEVVAFNKQHIERLKAGKIALEQTMKEVDVDNVEEMMEDIKENIDMADEIGEAMGRSLGNEEYDDEDLEKELEDLQNEEMEAEMLKAPEVPANENKVNNKKEGALSFIIPNTMERNRTLLENEYTIFLHLTLLQKLSQRTRPSMYSASSHPRLQFLPELQSRRSRRRRKMRS